MTENVPAAEPAAGRWLTSPPLTGVRVVSLAEQYPGPLATMILADLGADVILVERPHGGDPTRRYPGHFEALNRNKRSITVDLKQDEGRELFWRLAATADVVIEGFRPGVVDRLGVGPAATSQGHPDLIYASISCFGQTGVLSGRGGHDISIQGMAGIIRRGNTEPASLPLADLASAMFTVIGVVTALFARARRGHAARLDISMLDALCSWRATELASYLNGLQAAPYPSRDPGSGVYETRDGKLMTLSITGEDHQWQALCEVIGLGDLASLTALEREQAADRVRERIRHEVSGVDWEPLERQLAASGVGFGPVYDDAELVRSPHWRDRNLAVPAGEPGSPLAVRQPVLFDGWGGVVRAPAPRPGQHTAILLAELGYTEAEISRLHRAGVVATDAAQPSEGG
jgi:crotonobetainyl-CoA:carnitine CoA-transferase CaiB-like acyl-CoA transferase